MKTVTEWLMWLRFHARPTYLTTTGKLPCPYCQEKPL